MAGKAVLQFVVQFSCMAHGTLRNCFCSQRRVFPVAIKTPYGRLVETAVPFHSGGFLFVAFYTVGILKGCRLRRHGDSGICDHNYCGQKECIYNLYGRFVFHPSAHLPQIIKDHFFHQTPQSNIQIAKQPCICQVITSTKIRMYYRKYSWSIEIGNWKFGGK
jgi:hypothetical protein